MLSLFFCLFTASRCYWDDLEFYDEEYEQMIEDDILDTFGKCDICKILVATAEEAGFSQKSQLLNYLNQKVCSKLGLIEGLCSGVVESLIDKAWELIQQKVTPEVVCKKIRMC
ncbi:hypothetical protein BLNAU_3393 [Blattamonas nauphoetae]|uniref:Saposin B-type domain-containing protein n=1 Tax=Blattamonas nauphoetae TaxID=2049346 RepID=A0ABQ9YD17_9EUKA|nr:hypothetical protein BLNAU_3393 [Blattamonas nauphoetae]